MCGKQGLSSFSVETIVPVCEVWSSGSHLVTMKTEMWWREKMEGAWIPDANKATDKCKALSV